MSIIWFNSQLLNDDIIHEECLKEFPLYKDYIDDLKKLHVTKKNYQNLIALSNYLMIDNPDELIDKIVEIHDYDYNIIYDFEDFYKFNSKRLVAFETKDALETAIELYCHNHKFCFHTYGFISFWNISMITDLSHIFSCCSFNGDISNWNTSNATNMSYMFYRSKFNQDISKWDVSNVTNMNGMFEKSEFNQDISKWDVRKITNMDRMFFQSMFNQDISNWNVTNVTNMGSIYFAIESY